MSGIYSRSIPRTMRNAVMDEGDACRYCHVLWASVIDHVIPVAQGGATVIANLAPACQRCNAEKSGSTPAQWKERRLVKGLSWPPPDCQWALADLLAGLGEVEVLSIRKALVAAYPPMVDALKEFHDRYYVERPRSEGQDRDELLKVAKHYQDEVTV